MELQELEIQLSWQHMMLLSPHTQQWPMKCLNKTLRMSKRTVKCMEYVRNFVSVAKGSNRQQRVNQAVAHLPGYDGSELC
uniref:Uncharacterized protein n=1 Tax=Arundo donax TaxID=35708 RepID=A0A0A9HKT1_ARUDO